MVVGSALRLPVIVNYGDPFAPRAEQRKLLHLCGAGNYFGLGLVAASGAAEKTAGCNVQSFPPVMYWHRWLGSNQHPVASKTTAPPVVLHRYFQVFIIFQGSLFKTTPPLFPLPPPPSKRKPEQS